MEPGLAAALAGVTGVARGSRDPWWVIGSTAMALHGAAPLSVGDIDLLMSRRDAADLLARQGAASGPGAADDRFRSDVFGRFQAGGYSVEVMGGFHVHDGSDWREIVPQSRETVRVRDTELFVPSVLELIEMCRLFGRPKDAERKWLLRNLR